MRETDTTPQQARDQLERVSTKLSFLATTVGKHDPVEPVTFTGFDLEGFGNILRECSAVAFDAVSVLEDVMNGEYNTPEPE